MIGKNISIAFILIFIIANHSFLFSDSAKENMKKGTEAWIDGEYEKAITYLTRVIKGKPSTYTYVAYLGTVMK